MVARRRACRDQAAQPIEYHLGGIYRKLDMHSCAELISRFARGGGRGAAGAGRLG